VNITPIFATTITLALAAAAGPAFAQDKSKSTPVTIVGQSDPVSVSGTVTVGAPVAVQPAAPWQGTPVISEWIVFSPSPSQTCERAYTAPAGKVLLLRTIAGFHSGPPERGDARMTIRLRPLGAAAQTPVRMPVTPGPRVEVVGPEFWDTYSGSIDLAGVPVTEVDACVSGGVSFSRRAVGTLTIVGFVVDAPPAT
jgi:hypothetical protein